MKFFILSLSLFASLSSFAKQVPVENELVRGELAKVFLEIKTLKCENLGTEYRFSDEEMKTHLHTAIQNSSYQLFVEENSRTTLIVKEPSSNTQASGQVFTISFELNDNLTQITSATYLVEKISVKQKNFGNILRPQYEDVSDVEQVMNTICTVSK